VIREGIANPDTHLSSLYAWNKAISANRQVVAATLIKLSRVMKVAQVGGNQGWE
jgi:hypothetical protein